MEYYTNCFTAVWGAVELNGWQVEGNHWPRANHLALCIQHCSNIVILNAVAEGRLPAYITIAPGLFTGTDRFTSVRCPGNLNSTIGASTVHIKTPHTNNTHRGHQLREPEDTLVALFSQARWSSSTARLRLHLVTEIVAKWPLRLWFAALPRCHR